MSAENKLEAFKMENGEIWIGVIATGDTTWGAMGQVYRVVSKAKDYDEACREFSELCDEKSERYEYTEYGGQMPSKNDLDKQPECFIESWVYIIQAGSNPRYDYRNASKPIWRVVERSGVTPGKTRVIAKGLNFFEANNVAHRWAMIQPSVAQVAPVRFTLPDRKNPRERYEYGEELPGVKRWWEKLLY